MALRLSLQIDGDSAGAQKAATDTTKVIGDLDAQAKRTQASLAAYGAEIDKEVAALNRHAKITGSVIDQLKFESEQLQRNGRDRAVYNALRAAGVSINSQEGAAIAKLVTANEALRVEEERAANAALSNKGAIKDVALAAGAAGGPLGTMVARMGALSLGASRLGIGMIATIGTIGVLTGAVVKATAAFAAYEVQAVRLENIRRATGGGSGIDLDAIRGRLAGAGTQSNADIRAAQAELLRFRDIAGDVFPRALKQAQDLANLGFTDLASAAKAFGQALSNPVAGLDALREAGLRITPMQQKLLEDLFKSGQLLEFQNRLLKLTAEQLGGSTTAAADTLSGAFGRLSNASDNALSKFGEAITKESGLKSLFNSFADALNYAASAFERYNRARALGQSPMQAMEAAAGQQAKNRFPGLPAENYRQAGINALSSGGGASISNPNLSGFPGYASEIPDAMAKAIANTNIALDRQTKLYGLNQVEQQKFLAREQAQLPVSNQLTGALKAEAEGLERRVDAMMSVQFMRGVTDQSREQVASLEIEARVFGMSAGAAAAYRFEHEQLTRARIAGIRPSTELAAGIKAEAAAIGEATDNLERYRNAKTASDAVSGQFADALFNWSTGAKSASDAIKDLTGSLLRMTYQALLAGQGPLAGLFGTASSGGLFGGGLTSLFGGSSAPLQLGGVGNIGGTGGLLGALYDRGGYTGPGGKYDVAGYVHRGEVVFSQDDVQRHGGVAVVEALRRSGGFADGGFVGSPPPPSGFWPRGGGSSGGPAVEINLHQAPGVQSTQKESTGADGRKIVNIYETMQDAAVSAIGSGRADTALRARHGISPQTVRR